MMRKNKAAGLDGVVIEMIEALEEYSVKKLTEIINKIYDDGKFPKHLSKPIFITLPKKPSAVDCKTTLYNKSNEPCHRDHPQSFTFKIKETGYNLRLEENSLDL